MIMIVITFLNIKSKAELFFFTNTVHVNIFF
jgi:hypothetical protein